MQRSSWKLYDLAVVGGKSILSGIQITYLYFIMAVISDDSGCKKGIFPGDHLLAQAIASEGKHNDGVLIRLPIFVQVAVKKEVGVSVAVDVAFLPSLFAESDQPFSVIGPGIDGCVRLKFEKRVVHFQRSYQAKDVPIGMQAIDAARTYRICIHPVLSRRETIKKPVELR